MLVHIADEGTDLAINTGYAYYMAIPGSSKTFHLACMDGDTAAVQVIDWGNVIYVVGGWMTYMRPSTSLYAGNASRLGAKRMTAPPTYIATTYDIYI